MKFHQLEIPGVFLVEPERKEDRRGFFARTYCRHELEERGLDPTVVQCDISVNSRRGTVRGLHFQADPYPQIKLVRCTAGAIHDVLLDLRPSSPAYKRHVAVELTRENRHAVYVPEGIAHGFQALEDDTEVFCQTSEFHYPEAARGVRFDDPAFSIAWPLEVTVISEKDLAFPDFVDRPEL